MTQGCLGIPGAHGDLQLPGVPGVPRGRGGKLIDFTKSVEMLTKSFEIFRKSIDMLSTSIELLRTPVGMLMKSVEMLTKSIEMLRPYLTSYNKKWSAHTPLIHF